MSLRARLTEARLHCCAGIRGVEAADRHWAVSQRSGVRGALLAPVRAAAPAHLPLAENALIALSRGGRRRVV